MILNRHRTRVFLLFLPLVAPCLGLVAGSAAASELLLAEDFQGKLSPGWSWIREHRGAWRVTAQGLEVRVEPGNMWGPQNDARNVLVRAAPECASNTVEVAVTFENHPTNQYEQVDLVWYFDDSNMVKLGEELVDGKLSVVMGREERDQCRTVAIIPLESNTVHLRLFVGAAEIRGQFCPAGATDWRDVGRCTLPAPANSTAKVSLQFYQGPQNAEHWARVRGLRIFRQP